MDVREALYTTRAMRRVKPDPIPDDVLWAILDAAIRGPTGGNRQSWGWLVVRDSEVKRRDGCHSTSRTTANTGCISRTSFFNATSVS